jgi:hypothetical protein
MEQQLSITLSQDTYERLAQYAYTQNQGIAEAVTAYLEQHQPPLPDPDEMAQLVALRQEKEAFLRLYPALYKQYQGEYVAILDGQMVDHDANYHELYERILKHHPDTIVWISQIQDTPLPDIVVRSPRLEPI